MSFCFSAFFYQKFVHAEDSSSTETKDTKIEHQAFLWLNQAVNYIPNFELKNGVKKYLEILGLNKDKAFYNQATGGNNPGFETFFEKQMEQPCFNALFHKFYTRLDQIDVNRFQRYKGNPPRPNQGLFSDYPSPENLTPGWLWKIASEVSQGDSGVALALIGACGHDDWSSGGGMLKLPPSWTIEGRYLKPVADTQRENIKNKTHAYSKEVLDKLNYLLNQNPPTIFTDCPEKKSAMYLNQSLGKNTDINQDLRKELIQISGRGKSDRVPSKNYHIYAAAFMACQLKEAGVSDVIIQKIEEMTAYAYRTLHMKSVIDDGLKKYNKNQEQLLELKKNGLSTKDIFSNMDRAEVSLAAYLFSQWQPLTLKFNGESGIYFDKYFRAPIDLIESKITFLEKINQPEGYTKEQFQKAKQIAKSYSLDWKWTVEQHRIGADFGAEHCRKSVKIFSDLESRSCDAIKKTISPEFPNLDLLLPNSPTLNQCVKP